MADTQGLRLAVIAHLAMRADGRLGRTALMKFVFFLQAIRNVPLGYSYRLYTYGPYDAQVLDDLGCAEAMGFVESRSFRWPGGTGYTIARGPHCDEAMEVARDELRSISTDLDWVVSEFAAHSAGDLEVASTIIYVDRYGSKHKLSKPKIIETVHSIKPHHSEAKITSEYDRLAGSGLV